MKKWHESKTIRLAILTIFTGVLAVMIGNDWVASHPEWIGLLVAVKGAVDLILRVVTTEAIDSAMVDGS